jgi:predicted amidohydrolase
MVRVAAVQLRVDDDESAAAREDRACHLVLGAAETADLVILPELWPVGAFNVDLMLAAAEPIDGGFVRRMGDLAARAGVWLHAGSYPELHEGGVSNTSLVFDPEGRLRADYRKIHLFGFDEGEAVRIVAGATPGLVTTPLGLTGLTTCYDLRFPELYRRLLDEGSRAVLIPAGWPAARVEHWSVLARARAIENQCAVVACNAVGTNGGVLMGGRSVIVQADGGVLAEGSSTDEEIVAAAVDPLAVDAYRTGFPVLRDRRL